MADLILQGVKSSDSSPPKFQNSSGTEIGTLCRAWVNFNGTGTIAIRASFNVTSITDGGVGIYTVNYTTSMADANYCVSTGSNINSGSTNFNDTVDPVSYASGSTTLWGGYYTDNAYARDQEFVSISIFR